MHGCRLRRELGVCCAVLLLGVTGVQAEAPPTWIDDAELHDVQWVGSKHAIAVGEHGAIWNSSDGGRQWSQSPCGFDASLRSACFLTDQLGWVSGVDAVPHSPDEGGILLRTKDGGRTWQRLADRSLPPLNYVKFFNLEEGVIVGQPTSVAPSGILKTSDGGQSWHGVQGAAPRGWHAASFPELELGAVAGVQGRVSLMGGEQLFASKLAPQGFRSIRAIQLTANDSGWLAGDGSLVLKTTTKGVVWEPPTGSLPEELREGMDFLALETRGEKVWLAGSPGSVVWHSPDSGEHWTRQLTGQSTTLQGLRFSNDQLGIAVGALGLILRTEDGGRTWQAVRGGGRRVALLSFLARPGRTCPPLLAKLSGEQGYRSAVWIAQRNDLGPLATTEQDTNLQAAVQKCGGHSAEVHWQLPLTVPGLEFSSDKLVAAWQRQTEGRLPQTLLGGLVRQIRMWQPNIVVMDQPSSDDAVCQLLFDAVLHAVPQAADATRYVAQAELTGLASWKVDRIYVRLAAGATGDAHIELDEFLPYMKTSTRIAAGPSIALLQPGRVPLSESIESARIAYRWIGTDGQPATDTTTSRGTGGISAARSRDFFGSLSIVPGTAARRPMGPLDEANLERSQRLVQKQRNFTAIIQKSLDDPRLAGQMIGQLEAIIDGMEPGQAAVILRDLADEYRKRSQFEFVESTYVELVHRYPQEPVSRILLEPVFYFCYNTNLK